MLTLLTFDLPVLGIILLLSTKEGGELFFVHPILGSTTYMFEHFPSPTISDIVNSQF